MDVEDPRFVAPMAFGGEVDDVLGISLVRTFVDERAGGVYEASAACLLVVEEHIGVARFELEG